MVANLFSNFKIKGQQYWIFGFYYLPICFVQVRFLIKAMAMAKSAINQAP